MKGEKTNILIICIILVISIGFAILTANLSLNAQVGFKESSWDVHFDNIEVNEDSSELMQPTLDSKNTSLTFNTTINQPGEFYEFTVDVINAGTMDAALDSIVKSTLNPKQEEIIDYTVKSYDGTDLQTDTILHAGYSDKIIVRVEYSNDVDSLEHIDNINFSLELHYVKRNLEKEYQDNVWNIGYTEKESVFIALKTGTYQLEVWGAQGGYARNVPGGYGGYSTGNINLNKGDKLYINVGGAGKNNNDFNSLALNGGYNGGGNSQSTDVDIRGSAGGATHIATTTGLLKEFEDKQENLLIVAGAGGGAGYHIYDTSHPGGSAGGYIGSKGDGDGNKILGGSQLAAGTGTHDEYWDVASFGKGCSYKNWNSTGGGSGYYGGGCGFSGAASGAGGSSYIANPKLTNKSMYCYNCATSNDPNTKTISITDISKEAISKHAKIGNGFARITYLG